MKKYMITTPTHLDHEKFLCEWYADVEPCKQIWIQTSEDENYPKWKRLGTVFEEAILYPHSNPSLEYWMKTYIIDDAD